MATSTVDRFGLTDDVVDLVGERVADIEHNGRLPDDVVLALRKTGINRLALPRALGGLEAPVVDMMDVFEGLAAVDGSTAWCASIAAGSNHFAGYMSESGAHEVFADPDQGNASMFAPLGKVDQGSLLSGRWPFTSNCLHSSWIGVGAFVQGDDGVINPVPRLVFAPASDMTIEDTWHVVGLRGTGSHHTTATDLLVDLDRSCAFSDEPWPEGALWRLPLFTVLIPMLAAVQLGIARGAIDEIMRQAVEGRAAMRGQLAEDPISMAQLALADTQLRGARAAVREALEEARSIAEAGDVVDRPLRARILLGCMIASDVSVQVTSVAHALGGGAAAYADNPLLRALRDVETSRQHLVFSPKHRVELGKALAGLDVVYPPFVT